MIHYETTNKAKQFFLSTALPFMKTYAKMATAKKGKKTKTQLMTMYFKRRASIFNPN